MGGFGFPILGKGKFDGFPGWWGGWDGGWGGSGLWKGHEGPKLKVITAIRVIVAKGDGAFDDGWWN